MMNIGILGGRTSGIMGALLAALAAAAPTPLVNAVGNDRIRSTRRRSRHWYTSAQVKTTWPGQTEAQRDQRIAAAEAKRHRKACILATNVRQSFASNYAHWSYRDRQMGNLPKRFDPCFVAE